MRLRDLHKLLVKNGYSLIRTSGSHMIYKDGKGRTEVLTHHGTYDVSPKIVSGIKKRLTKCQ